MEEGERALERRGVGVGVFAWVELDVGEVAVVVDDAVKMVVADPRCRSLVERSPTRWPGTLKRASFFTSRCSSAPGRDHS
jgi:hypothetical protein